MLFTPRKLIPDYLLFPALPFSPSLTAGLSPVPRLLIISQTECREGVSGPEPRLAQQSVKGWGETASHFPRAWQTGLAPPTIPAAVLLGSRSGLPKPQNTREPHMRVTVSRPGLHHGQMTCQRDGLGRATGLENLYLASVTACPNCKHSRAHQTLRGEKAQWILKPDS